jgi:F0F1-type ATP synthase assembly protein I
MEKTHVSKTPVTKDPTDVSRQLFFSSAMNMSWQLALVVLVPVIGGVQLDKAFGTKYICTFIGLGLALLGSGVVMWRTMQAAKSLPVPKLTEAQKREIQKSYEEDDD